MRRTMILVMATVLVGATTPVRADIFGDFGRDEWDDLRVGVGATYSTGASNVRYTAPASSSPSYGAYRPTAQAGQVPAQRRPWSGDWWPRGSCGLAFRNTGGGLSPFEKYDTIVYDMYGRVPGSAAWEADPANGHNAAPSGGPSWGGHCNGLAAAAILSPEPVRPVRIPLQRRQLAKLTWASPSQCTFGLFRDGQFDYRFYGANGDLELTVDDMKGWLAEVFMTCQTQQMGTQGLLGTRYDNPTINYNDPAFQDIYPQNFHYLLDTLIRQRGQSFVAEIDPHAPVNNHPVYSYECSMQPQGYYTNVTTKVNMTDYAPRRNYVGTNTLSRTYTYRLQYDGSGRIVNGQWTGNSVSTHPDFVWIPSANQAPYGTYENPCVKADFASWLLQQRGAFR